MIKTFGLGTAGGCAGFKTSGDLFAGVYVFCNVRAHEQEPFLQYRSHIHASCRVIMVACVVLQGSLLLSTKPVLLRAPGTHLKT